MDGRRKKPVGSIRWIFLGRGKIRTRATTWCQSVKQFAWISLQRLKNTVRCVVMSSNSSDILVSSSFFVEDCVMNREKRRICYVSRDGQRTRERKRERERERECGEKRVLPSIRPFSCITRSVQSYVILSLIWVERVRQRRKRLRHWSIEEWTRFITRAMPFLRCVAAFSLYGLLPEGNAEKKTTCLTMPTKTNER